jgi:hypothetical protein
MTTALFVSHAILGSRTVFEFACVLWTMVEAFVALASSSSGVARTTVGAYAVCIMHEHCLTHAWAHLFLAYFPIEANIARTTLI